jgi:hypothetical protein
MAKHPDEQENEATFINFAALKTTIANGESSKAKQMIQGRSMTDLEKSYLIDLAKMNGQTEIIQALENIKTS